MSQSRATPGWVERERLAVCLRDVTTARAHLRAAQHRVPRGCGVFAQRMDLLAALEAYAEAITELGAPLPRQLRTEIDLHRRLGHRS